MLKKVILITGASGEIGENLINYYFNYEHIKIIAIDLKKPKNINKIDKFYIGSILDDNLLNKIDNQFNIQEIYHLAAVLSTKAENNPQLANDVNICGTLKIFDIAINQFSRHNKLIKFFFPSSIAVYYLKYKKYKKYKVNEYMFCNPKTIYGQNKLFCENIGLALDKYGNENNIKIDFRCIRFPGIISSSTLPSGGTSDYAPEMIYNAHNKNYYNCYVDKNTKAPFIVMPDAIDAIIKLMKTNKKMLLNNVYNITSFSPSALDLYKKIILYYPKFKLSYNINVQRQKIIDGWPGFLDDNKAKNDWGWSPKFCFHDAFDKYIIPRLKK